MATHCPNCQNPVDDDFGLIDCSVCGASFFLDLDGSVKLQSDSVDSDDSNDPEDLPSLPPSLEAMSPSHSEIHSGSNSESDIDREAPAWDFSGNLNNSEEEVDRLRSEDEEPPPFVDEFSHDESSTRLGQEEEFNHPGGAENLANLSELSQYGNSTDSMGREGLLRVRVTIQGIDTPELRSEVEEALSDKKFMWDTDGLMRSVKSGRLIIDNATPLKAAILIDRIKGMNLEIKWEQFAINMTSN